MGIEVTGSSVRVAQLRKKGKKWDILSLKTIENSEIEGGASKLLNQAITLSSLNSKETLVRPCELPIAKTKNLIAALDFYAEPLLPYPKENGIIQIQISEQTKQATKLSLFSVKKEHLNNHLENLKKLNIEPEIVTSKALALAAFSTLLPQSHAPLLLIHESDEEISFVLTAKGIVLGLRSIDRKNNFKIEIQKVLLSFASSNKNNHDTLIYYFGTNSDLKETIQTISGKTVLFPSTPLIKEKLGDLSIYGLAIGTAMASQLANFRQKEFAYSNRFKHLKKPFLVFSLLASLFTGSLYLLEKSFINFKKNGLDLDYSALMKIEEKNVQTLKNPSEYLAELNNLEKEIRSRPDTFPLLPQVPKVKEVLGWLVSLQESEGVVYESFNYQLIKSPDFSKKNEKYKVKVDLEISTPNGNAAKSFQEALKHPNHLIDTAEEIVWVPLKGKYKASFFLKDKTQYH